MKGLFSQLKPEQQTAALQPFEGDETHGQITPVNMSFERLPQCGCDPGAGPAPTKQQMLECKLRGGPCSPIPAREAQQAGYGLSGGSHDQMEALLGTST